MKTILNPKRNHYLARASHLLLALALIAGTVAGCNGGSGGDGESYTLIVSSTAGGSVMAPGEGTFDYDEETVADLVVEAEEGYLFDRWTGDVDTIADVYATTTNITVDGDCFITAKFAVEPPPNSHNRLITSSTSGGSVTTPGEGTFTYSPGTVVGLVAEAEAGEYYIFVEWTGDVDTVADVFAASTTITMSGNYSVTAEFVIPQYDLIVSSHGSGSVITPGEGTFTYSSGTVVTLEAQVEGEYWYFEEWTGDVDTIADVYAASTNITMSGDYSITAYFDIPEFWLSIGSTEGGEVFEPGEGSDFHYNEGEEVLLSACAWEGYHFVEWYGDVDTIDDIYDSSTTITMYDNYEIFAIFEEDNP